MRLVNSLGYTIVGLVAAMLVFGVSALLYLLVEKLWKGHGVDVLLLTLLGVIVYIACEELGTVVVRKVKNVLK